MTAEGDALRKSGAAADSNFGSHAVGSPAKPCKQKSWIDFRLVDRKGKPVSGMRFRLEDTEGRTFEGTTDSDGCAGEDSIDPGTCTITYLGYDSSKRR